MSRLLAFLVVGSFRVGAKLFPGVTERSLARTIEYFLLALVAFVWLVLLPSRAYAQETGFTAADYALMGIDAATILKVWSWGFGTVIFTWYLGFVGGVAKTAINKM